MNAIEPIDTIGFQQMEPSVALNAAYLFLRRRILGIIIVTLISLGLGAIYLYVTPPKYTATAKLLIEGPTGQISQSGTAYPESSIDSSQLESEIQIVMSENVAKAVVSSLHLDMDPEYVKGSDDFLTKLLTYLHWNSSPPTDDTLRRTMYAFARNLEVSRVGISNVLEIRFTSTNGEKSARVANAIAEAFIAEEIDARDRAIAQTGTWLKARLADLRQQAEAAEQAVINYRKDNNIVAVSGKLINEDTLADLNAQLAKARQATADAKAKFSKIQTIIDATANNGDIDAALGSGFTDPIVASLAQQYVQLSTQSKELMAVYGENFLEVKNIRVKMETLKDAIRRQVVQLGGQSNTEVQAAKQRESDIEAELQTAISQAQDTNREQIRLRELEDTAHSYQMLYNNYLQRSTEFDQIGSFPTIRARFVAPAVVPIERSRPKSLLVIAIAALGGLVFGFGFGFLRDLTDRVLRTHKDVEDQLRLPCVAIVPITKNYLVRPRPLAVSRNGLTTSNAVVTGPSRDIVQSDHVFWAVATRPLSRYTEAIRSMKLALDVTCQRLGRPRNLGFTSASPGEGKSTTATAFALHVAKTGARVILLDLDLRNPTGSRLLAKDSKNTLIGVLSGACKLQDAIWTEPNSELAFLPAPTDTMLTNTTELLGSVQLKQLIQQLLATYDYVIADLPPLNPLVDTRASASAIDNYVMIVEWGKTSIDTIRHALSTSPEIESALIGVVLNKADISVMPKYVSGGDFLYMNPDFKRYRFRD